MAIANEGGLVRLLSARLATTATVFALCACAPASHARLAPGPTPPLRQGDIETPEYLAAVRAFADPPAWGTDYTLVEVYRFFLISTFNPPTLVRYERYADRAEVTIQQLDQNLTDGPLRVKRSTRTVLSLGEAQHLDYLVNEAGIWSDSTPTLLRKPNLLDGSEWVLEAWRGHERRVIQVHSPVWGGWEGRFRSVGWYLTELAVRGLGDRLP